MGKLYEGYIRQGPDVLRDCLDRRSEWTAGFLDFMKNRSFRRVIILGSGSSWHCGLICQKLIQEITGVEVTCLTSTMAEGFPFRDGNLYFAISQSGTSNSTLGLMERLQAKGEQVVALTAELDSPIGQAADLTVPVLCGEEKIGPKSKGVLATIMALALLFLQWGRVEQRITELGYQNSIEKLKCACGSVKRAIRAGAIFYEQYRSDLLKAKELMIVAGPERTGAARECALKVLETCRLPVYAYEFEEYMHGIHYTLGGGRTMFYLLTTGVDQERMLALYRFGKEQGAVSFLLDLQSERDGAWLVPGDRGDICGSLSYVAFFQALSNALSEGRDIDCDRPRYPEFHARMGTKKLM